MPAECCRENLQLKDAYMARRTRSCCDLDIVGLAGPKEILVSTRLSY